MRLPLLFLRTIAFAASLLIALSASAKPADPVDALPYAFDFYVAGGPDTPMSMLVQNDGKVLVVGQCKVASFAYFCIARMKADWSGLDDTYDGSSAGDGRIRVAIGPRNDLVVRAALQRDGKLVLAGTCEVSATTADFCVVRLNADGTLDTSFTGPSGTADGRFMLPVGTDIDYLTALVIQPDGKILLGGTCVESSVKRICVVRLTSTGALDTSFDWIGASGGKYSRTYPGGINLGAMTLYADGTAFLVGQCNSGRICFESISASGGFFSPTGTLLGNSDYMNTLKLMRTGRMLMAGYCELGSGALTFCFNTYGNDPDFDGPSGTGNGKFALTLSASDQLVHLNMLPEGRILASGQCRNAADSNDVACIAVLNADGSFDKNFDGAGQGWVRYESGVMFKSNVISTALLPDGKVAVAAQCAGTGTPPTDVCLFRIQGWPALAPMCTMDIDGDGVVNSTTDALLLARVSMGFRGTAVTGGITFPATATRNTWPLIRDHLVQRCNMSVLP